MKYIRDRYGVPARRGARVTFCGTPHTIVASKGQYLRVREDGRKRIDSIHPTWNVVYLPA